MCVCVCVCACKDESTAACVCIFVCVSACTPLLNPYNQHVHHNYILPFAVKARSPGPSVKTFSTKYPDEVFSWVHIMSNVLNYPRGN